MNTEENQGAPLFLENEWCIYYDRATASRTDSQGSSWSSQQTKVGLFRTVEGFWSFWNNLVTPSRLPLEGTYSVFQSHIQPAWEDEHNASGGEVRMFFNKASPQTVDGAWNSLLLSVVGETLLEENVSVCGLTVSRKKHKSKICVWINRCDDKAREALDAGIRKTLGSDQMVKLGLQLDWTNHQHLLEKEQRKDMFSAGSGSGRLSKRVNIRVTRPPSIGEDLSN